MALVVRSIDSLGVRLSRAVAASTALAGILPPISFGGRRFMDGGTGSQTNADLAVGYHEVLILAPVDRGALAGELAALSRAGSVVRVIRPSVASEAALGEELGRLDPARCAAAPVPAGSTDCNAHPASRRASRADHPARVTMAAATLRIAA